MSKVMNWIYVKENYSNIFKENFGKESEVLDIINLSFSEARNMSQDELFNRIQRLECEMRFLVDNSTTNPDVASKLSLWCCGMIQNLIYCIDQIAKEGK